MTHSFIAYIDESGDDGLAKFREPGQQGGASSWLVISACVTRYVHHLSSVAWRDEISALMPEKKSRHIHFSEMNHHQMVATVQCLAAKPLRAISVISAKRTIPEGVYVERNQLYFYLTRYLIERISWFCRDMHPSVPEGDGTIKIIFSRRGGMSYADFRDYIDRLRRVQDQEINIHWPVIKTENIDAQDHSRMAGLQLVDTIASAFANGFEPDRYGNCERRYAEVLKPIVYSRRGNYLSYGVKLVPRSELIPLSEEQRRTLDLFK
jgi:hypothetical protein